MRRRPPLTKARVKEWLERRFFLRVHMSVILGGTFLAGLAATKLLLVLHVDRLALRYGLAVVAAWLSFLLFIRLWLDYVRRERSIDVDGDSIDFGFEIGGEAADAVEFSGGGGGFEGGGASGSWGDAAVAQPLKAAPRGGGGSSFDLGLDLDAEGCAILILLGALVAALLVAGVYLIWTAPAILAEAAFEAALAAALLKRAKKVDRPGWIGAVWRATFWPFLAILLLSVTLGWAVQKKCPEAKRVRDAFTCGDARKRI